jgi:uncharacterized RDD family membrane protein YckC
MGVTLSSQGVFFATQNYIGLWRRVLMSTVDIVVVLVGSVLVSVIPVALLSADRAPAAFLVILGITAFTYLVVLKRSGIRTLGYRLFGARIVSLSGETPSLLQMTERMLFAFFGPFYYLIDLLWLSGNDDRQSIRNKWAATYVVRHDAKPKGTGTIVAVYYYGLLGVNVVFWEVRRPSSLSN